MTLWWIGNALLLVVALVCVSLLSALYKQVRRLNKLGDTTLTSAVSLSQKLDALPKLLQTQQLTQAAKGLVGRYGAAVLGMVRG